MAPLSGEWLEALKDEFHQPYYAKLYKTVMQEYQTRKIFPPADDMFNVISFYTAEPGEGRDSWTRPVPQ